MTGLESRAMDLSGGGETRGTLLLVDDEENILSALKRLLRRDGYTLLSASSGEAGLEILARQPVDVILSDQRMPGMSGVEFLRQARTLRPETVRMVLSGSRNCNPSPAPSTKAPSTNSSPSSGWRWRIRARA